MILQYQQVNSLRISLASEPSGFTTEGSTEFTTAIVESNYTSIDAVDSQNGMGISSHFNGILGIDDYSSGYYIVSIDDTTNVKYQLSELVTVSSSTTAYYSEYGQLFSDGEVGVVTAGVAGTVTTIFFTANDQLIVKLEFMLNTLELEMKEWVMLKLIWPMLIFWLEMQIIKERRMQW